MNNDVFASEIGDAELLAYLDGAADAEVAAQIEGIGSSSKACG